MTYHRGISRGPIDGAPKGEDLPVVRIAFDRPEIRNAFRPHTVDELYRCLDHARMTGDVAAVILTGNGPSPRDGGYSFCSGGDQRIRGKDGYRYEVEGSEASAQVEKRREQIDPARRGDSTSSSSTPDSNDAQGRYCRYPRVGSGRWTQPQCRLRSLSCLA